MKNVNLYKHRGIYLSLTMILFVTFIISTLGLLVSILTKSKLVLIISSIAVISLIAFTLFLMFVLIPSM